MCRKAPWLVVGCGAADLCRSEIGVASTKAFTTQLTVLASLVVVMARATSGAIDGNREAALAAALLEVPKLPRAAEVLNHDEPLGTWPMSLRLPGMFYSWGWYKLCQPAVRELIKLKEISYIHAETSHPYAAGEMSTLHIKRQGYTPVIVIAQCLKDPLLEKKPPLILKNF